MGRLNDLEALGQAIWLDFVERKFLKEGGLTRLIEEDGLTGVTSNPSIFEKAMGQGDAYDADLAEFDRGHPGAPTIDRYEHLAIQDIRTAADILRPTYDRLAAKDGYVSLEVSPYLANDTDETIAEAERLWKAVDRPDLMIKIPGTPAGVPAIAASIAKGININVTLLFSIEAYKAVALAFVEGLEERVARGEPIDRIASVASFFVSRIDTKIDDAIDKRIAAGDPESEALKAVKGKVAIANAKLAYVWYQDFVKGDRWQALAAKGRDAATPAMGVDRHQEPGIFRCHVSRFADRPRYGQHRPAQDAGRIPRPRHRRRNADRAMSTRRATCLPRPNGSGSI